MGEEPLPLAKDLASGMVPSLAAVCLLGCIGSIWVPGPSSRRLDREVVKNMTLCCVPLGWSLTLSASVSFLVKYGM